jgi:hypothetical protein
MSSLSETAENMEKKTAELRESLIEEGRNQVLYLMCLIEDRDRGSWNHEKANGIAEARKIIIGLLKTERINWPKEWPNFQTYTYDALLKRLRRE